MNNLDRFNLLIKEKLSPVLKKRGFKKSELTWNKNYYDFIQVINIQKSKYSDSNLVDLTLNLGVFSTAVFEIIWDKKAPKIAKEENCLLRTRIGPVIQNDFNGTAKDHWWRIENDIDIEKLTSELIDNLENIAIPFLDTFTNINKINEFLTNLKGWQSEIPQHRLNMAVVAYQLGKVSDAEKIISEIINHHEPWKERCFIAAKNMDFPGGFGFAT
jgi:hypothetical protein